MARGKKTKPMKYSKKQLAIIRRNYAKKAVQKKSSAQKTERVEAPYPHFRYYRKSGHPALIVGEQKGVKDEEEIDEYRFRKVMHGEREGDRINETVYPNPDPSDPEPMRIAKRVRHDNKENFEPRPLPWKYPKK